MPTTSYRPRRWRLIVGERRGARRRWWPLPMLGARWSGPPASGARWAVAGERSDVARMVVIADSVGWLRQLSAEPVALARVRRVRIVVAHWRTPRRGWSGRLGPLPHLLGQRVRMPSRDHGRAVVDLELRWPVPLRVVLAAVLPVFTPVRPLPAPVSADLTALDVLPHWLAGGPNVAVCTGELPGDDEIRPHDVLLTPTAAPIPQTVTDLPGVTAAQAPGTAATPYGVALIAQAAGVRVAGAQPGLVVVDLEHAVVHGRYGPIDPHIPPAELAFPAVKEGRSWQIVAAGRVLCAGHLDRPGLTEEARTALAGVGLVSCPSMPARHPVAEAELLLHLTLAGVLVHAPALPPSCRAYLADEVAELIAGPLPGRQADELEWEAHLVRQRRAVMRGHAGRLVLPRFAATVFPASAEPPSVTALLVTRRLENVAAAVAAIESQTYPNLEIVLCLHGIDLPAGMRARLGRCRRPLEILTLPATHSFGEAIGVATARSRGSLVTKFDDDDTYGPEHVWDLVLARHHSGATLIGKSAEFVYLWALDTTVRRDPGTPESYATLVAGGTMLIGRGDLEQIGGWRPVPRSIDRGLLDRVHRAGGLVYRTHPLGYVYHRHSAGHTWEPGLEYFLRGSGMQWSGLPRHREFGTQRDS